MDLSQSFESCVSCSAALPVSSRLTDVPVSKSLSTEGNRMPEKSIWLESSLVFKEKTAEEIPGERNQLKSSSLSSPSQEPEIKPLQDLTNARTLTLLPGSRKTEDSSRRRRGIVCYKEPTL
ncbi:hypothetical protein N332_03657, partial [Mesitornis unicolor]